MGKNSNPKPAVTPASMPQPPIPMQKFPEFQPGQQGLLAEQMNAGFGGGVAPNMAALNNLYSPVSMPIITKPSQIGQYLAGIGPKPAPRPAGTASGGGPRPKPKTAWSGGHR